MIIQLINDKTVSRGGAQQIVKEIEGIVAGALWCLNDSERSNKVVALLDIYWRVINATLGTKTSVIAHSRMYLPLLLILRGLTWCRLSSTDTVFYLHAAYRRRAWLFRLFAPHRFVAVSNACQEYLMRQNIDTDSITIIPNPLLSASIQSEVAPVLTQQSDVIRLFSVGALQAWKGFEETIVALSKATIKLQRKIEYTIIGQGPSLNDLQKLVASIDNDSLTVIFMGYQNEPYTHVKNCPIQVIPSYEEGFGLVAIEGVYHHKMVLYRRIPALIEIVGNDLFSCGFDQETTIIDQLNVLITDKNSQLTEQKLKNRQKAIEVKYGYDKFVMSINDTLVSK